VSKTAVSFAFNAPDRLSSDKVTHIHDIATAMGYRPDPVARSLAQRRTGTLGILTPQSLDLTFNNPYHALFAAGVAAEAERGGACVLRGGSGTYANLLAYGPFAVALEGHVASLSDDHRA
jgi:DNA-binding LacI/PurR family transcriptional regulator